MKCHALTVKLFLSLVATTGCCLFADEPTFSLKNKSTETIHLDIKQNNTSITGLKSIAKDSDFESSLDTSKPTLLEIHVCPNIGQCFLNDHDTFFATINAGKTMYLKFDGKMLVPQKGSAKGGKTTKGHSTKNNVTKNDFSVTKGMTKSGNADIRRAFQKNKPQ